MDDEEFGVFDADALMTPSRPMRRIDLAIVGVGLVRGLIGAVHEAWATTEMLLCAHANHEVDQQQFADEVRRQIETITLEE